MEKINIFDIAKLESILHKILLNKDTEKEIFTIGKDDIYNDKMYYYLGVIIDNIEFNKYYFYRTEGILEHFKEFLLLMNKNYYQKEILELRSKMNEIIPGNFDDLIQIQVLIRTFGNFHQVYKYSRDVYSDPNILVEQMIKDYDLIKYFEGKDSELASDNINSLIYFYNMFKHMYLDTDIYAKTIMLLNTNLDALKERKMIFSPLYSDNKKLLKELGGKRV